MKRGFVIVSVVIATLLLDAVLAFSEASRTEIRWLVSSRTYKSKLLSHAAPGSGGLQHIEWDGWGWGSMDTTVYLVFDPSDALLAAANSHASGKFTGLPCKVFRVRRLERQWYTVQFFTDEDWDGCVRTFGRM